MWKKSCGPVFSRTRDRPISPEHRAGRTGTRGPLPAAGPRQRGDSPTVCGCSVAHHRAQGPTSGRQLRMEEQAGPLFCPSVCPALTATVQGQHPHPVEPRPAPMWEDPQGQGWVDAERGHRGECGENQLSLPPANSSLRCSGRWKKKQENRDSMTLLAFPAGGGGVG